MFFFPLSIVVVVEVVLYVFSRRINRFESGCKYPLLATTTDNGWGDLLTSTAPEICTGKHPGVQHMTTSLHGYHF